MAPLLTALALTLALVTVCYIVWAYANPFGPCWLCRGKGCPRCRDTGLQSRVVWRLWAFLTDMHRDADHRKHSR